MKEITLEELKQKYPNGLDEKILEDIDRYTKNNKNELKKILEALGMGNVLKDGMYKEGKRKIFPIHFQVLCKVLLMQERSKKENLIYKIKNKRLKEIEKEEVDKFVAELDKALLEWFQKLEYVPIDDKRRSKEELDDIYSELEKEMEEDMTTEYIEELDKDKSYSKEEVEYLKTKFSIRMQGNVLKKSIEDNLWYRIQFELKRKLLHDEIDKVIDEKLDMDSIIENMVLLEDYKSDLIGTVPVPKIFVDNNNHNRQPYHLSNKKKIFFLDKLYSDIEECLKCLSKEVECLVKRMNKNNQKRKV